jgi:hypothetical protein
VLFSHSFCLNVSNFRHFDWSRTILIDSDSDEPTDWVSNMVVATKSSSELRFCVDPNQLNKALKRERYPIPVIEDLMPDIARVFTKVDARNGMLDRRVH